MHFELYITYLHHIDGQCVCHVALGLLQQFILWPTQKRNRQGATSSKLGSTLDFGDKKNGPYNSFMKELRWLPVHARIRFKILLLTYKILNGLAPNYLSSTLAGYQPARFLRTSNRCLLRVPTVSTVTYGLRLFFILCLDNLGPLTQ